MQVKKTWIKLVVAALLSWPFAVQAQTSSINAFSPYTMYGIGELNTPGTLPMRSMGGVGVAMRSGGVANLLNPAALSAMPQKSFLLNFGMEGQNFYNAQTYAGQEKRSAYNTFNFHEIALQMPLAKKMGLGFSLMPYSSVGYRVQTEHFYDPNDPVWGNVGPVRYGYLGEGDVTEVKLSYGWEPVKNLSVGVALQYYWGSIERDFSMVPTTITGTGEAATMTAEEDYSISSIKGQIGVQWDALKDTKRILTVGATYDFGGDLNPRLRRTIKMDDLMGTEVDNRDTHLKFVLPSQLQVGAFYQTAKWSVGLDYVFQNWGGRNKGVEKTGVSGAERSFFDVRYVNTSTLKVGVEFTPDRYSVRRPLKRWSYRAGFRYGDYNQTFGGERLSQLAVTLGVGVPVKLWAVSGIDVGVEYGRRGFNVAERVGLVRQQYVRFAVGFRLFAGSENSEYWFLRPKYD